jgi:hypothetical protein
MRQDGDTIVYRDNDEQLKQLSPKERDAIKKKVNVSTSRYSCDQKKKNILDFIAIISNTRFLIERFSYYGGKEQALYINTNG